MNHSNVITPPDIIGPDHNDVHLKSVLLIDPYDDEVEAIVLYLKASTMSYNVYIYRTAVSEFDGMEWWLQLATNMCDSIVINTATTVASVTKDVIAVNKNAFYYGQKNFLTNKNRIEHAIDWFLLKNQHIKSLHCC